MANNLASYNDPTMSVGGYDECVIWSIRAEVYHLAQEFIDWCFENNLVDDDNWQERCQELKNDKKVENDYIDYRYEFAEQEYND